MSTVFASCDLLEMSPELSDLKKKVLDYEDLLELCMMTQLSAEDQKTLDDLFAYLRHKEDEYWVGVSPSIVEIIKEHGSLDFPMIRHELGMLPTKD